MPAWLRSATNLYIFFTSIRTSLHILYIEFAIIELNL
jgi:hypothetical protein